MRLLRRLGAGLAQRLIEQILKYGARALSSFPRFASTVQTVAGQARLGEAAASVQFSRSLGAGFGTALVATALFATLAIKNPEAARAFAAMIENVKHVGPALPAIRQAAIQSDIADAFRVAFLVIGGFTLAAFFLALTNPLRKL